MTDIVWKKREAYTDDNPSSPTGRAHYELGVNRAPEHSSQELPGHYGIPLFELLVVDPDYLFVSWEIPESQLNRAAEALGDLTGRRLVVRLRNPGDDGRIVLSQELYGEQGRWFFRHNMPGRRISGDLGFICSGRFFLLNSTGPLWTPRNFTVEPEAYEELSVVYARGAGGELVIKGFRHDEAAPWPDTLPPAGAGPGVPAGRHPHAPPDPAGASGGLPSSPGPGLPSSPWSGAMYSGERPARRESDTGDSNPEGDTQ